MTAPPPAVLAAFAADGPVEELLGGMLPVFRVGSVVIKPVGDPVESAYIAEVMAGVEVDPERVRVARPVPSTSGTWVVDGWSASTAVEGGHGEGAQPWAQALDAADALHEALRSAPRAPFLAERTHRWAVADRVAWGEEEIALDPRLEPLRERLLPLVGDPTDSAQLVHSDLCGNLLFHPTQPPAVIDFSPGWRPPSFAKAIYAVDALGWHHGDEALLDLVRAGPSTTAVLARAGIFRVVAYHGRVIDLGLDLDAGLADYQRIVDRLEALLTEA